MDKKISIVTVVKNGQSTIRDCIESVLKQKASNIEFIIVDGSSDDGTMEIVSEYGADIDICISERDQGIYDAWNKGIHLSKGQYIAFLGADDRYLPGALSAYSAYFEEHPDVDYVSSRARFNDQGRRIFGRPWKWSEFRRHFFPAHVGSMHSRRLFDRYGLFDINYKIAGDYDFLLRIGSALNAGYIDQVTVEMGAYGVSNSRIFKLLSETKRAKLQNHSVSVFESNLDYVITLLAFYKNKIKNAV